MGCRFRDVKRRTVPIPADGYHLAPLRFVCAYDDIYADSRHCDTTSTVLLEKGQAIGSCRKNTSEDTDVSSFLIKEIGSLSTVIYDRWQRKTRVTMQTLSL